MLTFESVAGQHGIGIGDALDADGSLLIDMHGRHFYISRAVATAMRDHLSAVLGGEQAQPAAAGPDRTRALATAESLVSRLAEAVEGRTQPMRPPFAPLVPMGDRVRAILEVAAFLAGEKPPATGESR